MQKGFAPLIVLFTFAILAAGVGFYSIKNKTSMKVEDKADATQTPAASSSPTNTPISTPKSTLSPTKRPVVTVTTSPVSQNNCSRFKPENGPTSVTITLKEKDGKALSGDWVVEIKPTGSCPGILPPHWGSKINEVVRQPNYTYTSPGMGPGQFRVDVKYHLTGEGFDWEGTSGSHAREVVVSDL